MISSLLNLLQEIKRPMAIFFLATTLCLSLHIEQSLSSDDDSMPPLSDAGSSIPDDDLFPDDERIVNDVFRYAFQIVRTFNDEPVYGANLTFFNTVFRLENLYHTHRLHFDSANRIFHLGEFGADDSQRDELLLDFHHAFNLQNVVSNTVPVNFPLSRRSRDIRLNIRPNSALIASLGRSLENDIRRFRTRRQLSLMRFRANQRRMSSLYGRPPGINGVGAFNDRTIIMSDENPLPDRGLYVTAAQQAARRTNQELAIQTRLFNSISDQQPLEIILNSSLVLLRNLEDPALIAYPVYDAVVEAAPIFSSSLSIDGARIISRRHSF